MEGVSISGEGWYCVLQKWHAFVYRQGKNRFARALNRRNRRRTVGISGLAVLSIIRRGLVHSLCGTSWERLAALRQ